MQKFRLTLIVAVTLFMSLGFLVAETPADVKGKWEITIKSPRGDKIRAIEILQDGENLTIKQQNKQGKIKEAKGTIKGNVIQWSTIRGRNDRVVTILYKGTVTGDTMSGEFQLGKIKARPWQGRRLSDK